MRQHGIRADFSSLSNQSCALRCLYEGGMSRAVASIAGHHSGRERTILHEAVRAADSIHPPSGPALYADSSVYLRKLPEECAGASWRAFLSSANCPTTAARGGHHLLSTFGRQGLACSARKRLQYSIFNFAVLMGSVLDALDSAYAVIRSNPRASPRNAISTIGQAIS